MSEESMDDPQTRLDRWYELRIFGFVAAGLLAVLVLGVFVMDNGNTAVPDEGVYAAQVKLVASGNWDAPETLASFDPDGTRTAVRAEFVKDGRYSPYPRHPAFTVFMLPFYKIDGFRGLLVASAIAAWAAAVAAGLLARRVRPSLGIPAMLMLALGSPLVFDAYLAVGHAVGAAACGFAVLSVTRAVDDRRWWSLAWGLPLVALTVTLRTEGVLVMGALGGVLGLVGVVAIARRKDGWPAAIVGAAVVAVTGAGYVLDTALTRAVTGSGDFGSAPTSKVLGEQTGPSHAAWVSLFRPWNGDALHASWVTVLAVVAAVAGALMLRLMPKRWLLGFALLAMSALSAVVQIFGHLDLITGLFAAFPLLAGGLILLRWSDVISPLPQRLLATAMVTGALLLITIYDEGGTVEWGGRFFHILLPLLVPLVVLGLAHAHHSISIDSRVAARGLTAIAVVVSLSFSVTGLRVNHMFRQVHRQAVESTVQFAQARRNGRTPLVIVGFLHQNGTSRMFWNKLDQVDVLSSNGIQDLLSMLGIAKAKGYDSVVVMSDVGQQLLEIVGSRQLAALDWGFVSTAPAGRSGWVLYEFGPRARS